MTAEPSDGRWRTDGNVGVPQTDERKKKNTINDIMLCNMREVLLQMEGRTDNLIKRKQR